MYYSMAVIEEKATGRTRVFWWIVSVGYGSAIEVTGDMAYEMVMCPPPPGLFNPDIEDDPMFKELWEAGSIRNN